MSGNTRENANEMIVTPKPHSQEHAHTEARVHAESASTLGLVRGVVMVAEAEEFLVTCVIHGSAEFMLCTPPRLLSYFAHLLEHFSP